MKKRIIIYIIILALSISFFGDIYNGLVFTAVIVAMLELIREIKSKKVLKNLQTINDYNENEFKKCKYCMEEIDYNAKVCPNCRRNQSNANNPLLLIPIFIIIGIFLYCFFSPNAPETAREIFCSLGLRKGYPYCIKLDIDAINNYSDEIDDFINNYDYGDLDY
ncbi:MAG: hypothetical protein J6O56_01580 [Bacilli bacterium]|nr:hypothetical protein [Bacilli bacterium]